MATARPSLSAKSSKGAKKDQAPLKRLPLSSLLLDPLNPRLPEFAEPPSQDDLLALVVKRYSVADLIESFATNGYFEEEPLVGVPSRGNMYTVVEGNRRLAALKLLFDPARAKQLRVTVPILSPSRRKRLERLPIQIHRTRAEVLPYLGYRHITGVMQWDSFSKARYVDQLVRQGQELKTIQRKIGDRHETAPRLYRAYLVWRDAAKHGFISENGESPPFSYLFTALTYKPFLDFLGLSNQGVPRRVSSSRIGHLKELSTYLYGSKEPKRDAAIGESRQIKDLAQAITSARARALLKRGATVEEALEAIPAQEARLERLLNRGADALADALHLVQNQKKNAKKNAAIRDIVERCLDLSKQLGRVFSLK